MTQSEVPYFSQWESAELATAIVNGTATPAEDPLWQNSGAKTREEYAIWANHICGMACLKMIIAAQTGNIVPTVKLAQQACSYGVYVVKHNLIRGMIYAPFVTFVRERYNIDAQIHTGITSRTLSNLLQKGSFFIASVHPNIRWPKSEPPQKGGHLILISKANDDSLVFHNPSGHSNETRSNVSMSLDDFDRFFAGRGLLVSST
ncbi:MAG: C39 family peptidase [Bdellovibrionales bacterium]